MYHSILAVILCTFQTASPLEALSSPSVVLQHLTKGHGAKQTGRFLTGKSVLGPVTDERLLVKDGPVAAEEAPLGGGGDHAVVVLDRQADVEYLTPTLHVSVVAVVLPVTAERLRVVRPSEDVLVSSSQAGPILPVPTLPEAAAHQAGHHPKHCAGAHHPARITPG